MRLPPWEITVKAGFFWGWGDGRGGKVSDGGFPPGETELCPALCVNRTEVDMKAQDGVGDGEAGEMGPVDGNY